MTQLVLSLMPGIDLLGLAFEEHGFCVVRGPDVIFGGDIRGWHVPAGRFEGIIAGPPCQCFSRLAHMVRHNGYEPKFGNLIPEFERVCEETQPGWFLMEEVPDAPLPVVAGYATWSTLLNNRQLGEKQNRLRRWTFGVRGPRYHVLQIETVALESAEYEYAATGGSCRPHGQLTGGNDRKRKAQSQYREGKGRMPWNAKSEAAFREVCRKQGLPDDFDLPGWTVAGKCKAVGNGVPMSMGRALAKAVREFTEQAP